MLPSSGAGSTYRYVGANARRIDGGWESVGDMGRFDADGYLYLVDRRTDMIVTGGANVYPAEGEAAIDAHPGVRSSAVFGVPVHARGPVVHAIVDVPELDPADAAATEPFTDELRAALRDRIVTYKVPRSFEFVREPLRDDAGKVRRSALRDERVSSVDAVDAGG
jgi:bile acid-coenzyme A ligase